MVKPKSSRFSNLERLYRDLEPAKIGLSLDEGKHVLHEMEKIVVTAQAGRFVRYGASAIV